MDELIKEVEEFAKLVGRSPSTVLQDAAATSGQAWAKWVNGGTCSMKIADRVRKYIRENQPIEEEGAAA